MGYNPRMNLVAETLVDSIERVTFHNRDNGFAVLKTAVKGGGTGYPAGPSYPYPASGIFNRCAPQGSVRESALIGSRRIEIMPSPTAGKNVN